MLHGCNGVDGGTALQVLVPSASYLPNATLWWQLSLVLPVTSYIGHIVSVQTSTGTIVGCGRLENLFHVDAFYRGKNTLSQFSPYLPATLADVSNSDILQYNILEGIAGTCSSKAAIFDPWSPPGRQVGSQITVDQFPVGDLPNHVLEVLALLPEVPLIGSASILGHVVCNRLKYNYYIIIQIPMHAKFSIIKHACVYYMCKYSQLFAESPCSCIESPLYIILYIWPEHMYI